MNFDTIKYLQKGTPKQKEVFDVLENNRILFLLNGFTPILVGTYPINIDIASSDIDIICYWENKSLFINQLRKHFNAFKNFTLSESIISDTESVVANFEADGFEIEIFGQDIPVKQQNGYLHMIAEYEILKHKGEDFREQIIKLKRQGYKTEPAFGKLLGLEDPYRELLYYNV